MTQQNPLQLAKQGNPNAIAALINRSLNSQGITAKVIRKDDCLRVLLESNEVPKQNNLSAFIHNGVLKLEIPEINTLQVFGRQTGEQVPAWSQTINLKMPLSLIDQQPIEKSQNPHTQYRQKNISSFEKSDSPIAQKPTLISNSEVDEAHSELRLLREAAKKGDLQAISSLVSRAIAPRIVTVEAEVQYGTTLCLKLYQLGKMQGKFCVQAVIEVLNDIQPDKISSVTIAAIASDKRTQVWNRFLTFKNGKFVDNTISYYVSVGIMVALIIGLLGYCYALPKQSNTVSSSSSPKTIVQNSPWDGSVFQVKSWLEDNLKDPKSLEYIEWSAVQKTDDGGFIVRVKYRAKNSFGGYVIENKVFSLDSAGTVTNSIDR
jgi:hypothetical protein